MYSFFVHSYVASKRETKEKMEVKVTMRLIVRLNLSSDGVRNCKETTFVKKWNPQFGVYTRTFICKIQGARKI